ncbi:hypothetical protein PHLGIDRAFT_122483 [Phlebiopsis gigantea 11061_1 CR5-6]|uniref:Uncharacterized protein n=1 Tax=Phlebiopsis gigantea (strain 11061_1 CR5-6) TaxID=745531 RepID=A0A0C3RR28_PHLG1|nr:hypothetical protein PHLGIDRAFT_122483 [Phlebiopsis gigantea 11061_1 CR5-6]
MLDETEYDDPALAAHNPVTALLQSSVELRGAALKLLAAALDIRLNEDGIGHLEHTPWVRIQPVRLIIWRAKLAQADEAAPLKELQFTTTAPLLRTYELTAFIIEGMKCTLHTSLLTSTQAADTTGHDVPGLWQELAISLIREHLRTIPLLQVLICMPDYESTIIPSCLRGHAQNRPLMAAVVGQYLFLLEVMEESIESRIRRRSQPDPSPEEELDFHVLAERSLDFVEMNIFMIASAQSAYEEVEDACRVKQISDLDDFFDFQRFISLLHPYYTTPFSQDTEASSSQPPTLTLPLIRKCVRVILQEWAELREKLKSQGDA